MAFCRGSFVRLASVSQWNTLLRFLNPRQSKQAKRRGGAEAQKPKTFRIAAFYAQKYSGRSAWLPFSRHLQQARNSLSRRTDNERKCLSQQYIMHFDTSCDSIETVRIVLKPSGQYWNRLDSIETVRTVLKPSGQYWNCPDSIYTFQKQSQLSREKQHFAWV